MTAHRDPIVILMVDDDEDDRLLTRDALAESHVVNDLRFVGDGHELFEYLRQEGDFSNPADAPRPGIILLDLNMPRMDGRESLMALKADPLFRRIPVVVMTTSQDEEDMLRSYDLGASSFISKPITFEGLVAVMKSFGTYWFEIVALPGVEQ